MIRSSLSTVDLNGLVRRAFAGTTVGDDLRNDPRGLLADHGILVPSDVRDFSVRRFHQLPTEVVQECANFDDFESVLAGEHPFELRLFWYGAKDVVFLLGKPRNLRFLGALAVRRGFYALLTPYQWIPESEQAKSGFSNSMNYTPLTDGRTRVRRGLFVARSENDIALAWLSCTLGWDSVLGRVLSYPSCCIQSFCEHWTDAQAQHCGDLVPVAIQASGPGPFDWRTNVLGRYFGRCLLQHFPCTFACAASVALAERILCCLMRHEPDLAQRIKELMCAPAVYTARSGVFVFPGAEVDICEGEWGMRYDPTRIIASTRASEMFRYLRQTDTIIGLAGTVLRIDTESEAYLLRFH